MHLRACVEIVQATRNFGAYPVQAAHDAMQMDIHKTLYPFCPLVCAG